MPSGKVQGGHLSLTVAYRQLGPTASVDVSRVTLLLQSSQP